MIFKGSLAALEGSMLRMKGSLMLRIQGEFRASPSRGVSLRSRGVAERSHFRGGLVQCFGAGSQRTAEDEHRVRIHPRLTSGVTEMRHLRCRHMAGNVCMAVCGYISALIANATD